MRWTWLVEVLVVVVLLGYMQGTRRKWIGRVFDVSVDLFTTAVFAAFTLCTWEFGLLRLAEVLGGFCFGGLLNFLHTLAVGIAAKREGIKFKLLRVVDGDRSQQ